MPIATARRLLRRAYLLTDQTTIALRLGITTRLLYAIEHDRTGNVGFSFVDALVTTILGDPYLWHTDKELAAVYRQPRVTETDGTCPDCGRSRHLQDIGNRYVCRPCRKEALASN